MEVESSSDGQTGGAPGQRAHGGGTSRRGLDGQTGGAADGASAATATGPWSCALKGARESERKRHDGLCKLVTAYRWSRDTPWETSVLAADLDFDWKKTAEPVMQLYTEATDGSYIEHKESGIVWHHHEADPDFGSSQAKELLDHLENVLANEPVVVKRGQHIVEVNPQGISKGVVVESLLSSMVKTGTLPDFVLCIGDDRSDEDMFESIVCPSANASVKLPATSCEVFACTVGKKPSMAKYYLDDTVDVIKMLEALANATTSQRRPRLAVQLRVSSFEGSL